ncbi:hypothetical protein ANO11243_056300 [Dothideomycetidae sp. 11243]|nr:hypothetical protein ANO11243_056300 [fungal sp. No.11243]
MVPDPVSNACQCLHTPQTTPNTTPSLSKTSTTSTRPLTVPTSSAITTYTTTTSTTFPTTSTSTTTTTVTLTTPTTTTKATTTTTTTSTTSTTTTTTTSESPCATFVVQASTGDYAGYYLSPDYANEGGDPVIVPQGLISTNSTTATRFLLVNGILTGAVPDESNGDVDYVAASSVSSGLWYGYKAIHEHYGHQPLQCTLNDTRPFQLIPGAALGSLECYPAGNPSQDVVQHSTLEGLLVVATEIENSSYQPVSLSAICANEYGEVVPTLTAENETASVSTSTLPIPTTLS